MRFQSFYLYVYLFSRSFRYSLLTFTKRTACRNVVIYDPAPVVFWSAAVVTGSCFASPGITRICHSAAVNGRNWDTRKVSTAEQLGCPWRAARQSPLAKLRRLKGPGRLVINANRPMTLTPDTFLREPDPSDEDDLIWTLALKPKLSWLPTPSNTFCHFAGNFNVRGRK